MKKLFLKYQEKTALPGQRHMMQPGKTKTLRQETFCSTPQEKTPVPSPTQVSKKQMEDTDSRLLGAQAKQWISRDSAQAVGRPVFHPQLVRTSLTPAPWRVEWENVSLSRTSEIPAMTLKSQNHLTEILELFKVISKQPSKNGFKSNWQTRSKNK